MSINWRLEKKYDKDIEDIEKRRSEEKIEDVLEGLNALPQVTIEATKDGEPLVI